MRCFVCAGTHSSKLFEFEFECCTVRLGDSPRKPFHNLLLRLSSLLFHVPPSSRFIPPASSCSSLDRTPYSSSLFPSLPPVPRHPHSRPYRPLFFSLSISPMFPFSRSLCSLCQVRFLEPPSLNPNPKVRRSTAFLGFDSCYRAKLPPQ